MARMERRVGSVFTSCVFTVGLLIIIAVLLFNYWTLLTRNNEAIREAHKLRIELQQLTSTNAESLKKWESCKTDTASIQEKSKKLDDELKRKETTLADISAKMKETKRLQDATIEERNRLKEQLATAEREKAEAKELVEKEKSRCQESAKTMAKDCLEVCDKRISELRETAVKTCQQQIAEQLSRLSQTSVAMPVPVRDAAVGAASPVAVAAGGAAT